MDFTIGISRWKALLIDSISRRVAVLAKRLRRWDTKHWNTEISAHAGVVLAVLGGLSGLIGGYMIALIVFDSSFWRLTLTLILTCAGVLGGLYSTPFVCQYYFRIIAQRSEHAIHQKAGSEVLGERAGDAVYQGLIKTYEGQESEDLGTKVIASTIRGGVKLNSGKDFKDTVKDQLPDVLPLSVTEPLVKFVDEKVLPNIVHETKIATQPTRDYKCE